jgi:hypothetical protein
MSQRVVPPHVPVGSHQPSVQTNVVKPASPPHVCASGSLHGSLIISCEFSIGLLPVPARTPLPAAPPERAPLMPALAAVPAPGVVAESSRGSSFVQPQTSTTPLNTALNARTTSIPHTTASSQGV